MFKCETSIVENMTNFIVKIGMFLVGVVLHVQKLVWSVDVNLKHKEM